MIATRHAAALAGVFLVAVAAAGGAGAEDLSKRATNWPKSDSQKPEPDRRCAFLGNGYMRAPGSDTCIRVGGSVRTEASSVWSR